MVGAGQQQSRQEKLRLEIFISSVYISLTFPTFLHHSTPPGPLSPLHWRAQGPVCVATVMSIRACQRGDKINKQCEGEHCDALWCIVPLACASLSAEQTCMSWCCSSDCCIDDMKWCHGPWVRSHRGSGEVETTIDHQYGGSLADCWPCCIFSFTACWHLTLSSARSSGVTAAAELQCSRMKSVAWEC